MKILIIGDLHGKRPKIRFKEFDTIIAPGDFCSDKPRKYMFEALRKNLENPFLDVEWFDITGKKKAKDMIKKSLQDGKKIIKFLDSLKVPVYIVPGNWDWTKRRTHDIAPKKDYFLLLTKGLKNITDCNYKIKSMGDCIIIGYGETTGPEYPIKKELRGISLEEKKEAKKEYNKIYDKIDSLFAGARKKRKPLIFLSHNVPYNTSLDKITDKKSPRYGEHFGSIVARKMIEKYNPLLFIGGHMHEHFGKCYIKKTLCINSGYGSKPNILIDLQGQKIKSIKFLK